MSGEEWHCLLAAAERGTAAKTLQLRRFVMRTVLAILIATGCAWARPLPYYPGFRDVRPVQAEYEYQPATPQMPTLKEKTYYLTVTFLPQSEGKSQIWLDTDLGDYPLSGAPGTGRRTQVRQETDRYNLVDALTEVTHCTFFGGCGQFDPNRAAVDHALAWLVPWGKCEGDLYSDILLAYANEAPLPQDVQLVGRAERFGYATETYEKRIRDGVVRVTTSPNYPLVFDSWFHRHDGQGKDVTSHLVKLKR